MHTFRVRMTASIVLKSTTTSAPACERAVGGTPMSTAATSRQSLASFTASTTACPMRPLAPTTPTLIMWEGYLSPVSRPR